MINISNTELTILRDKGISFNKHDLINLTTMWRLHSGKEHERVREWLKRKNVQQFVIEVTKKYQPNQTLPNGVKIPHLEIPEIIEKRRGRYGGTYAHCQIALAYAKYLNHELHMFVNEVFVRYSIADPTLAADMAERMPADKRDWLSHRIAGIEVRKNFTKVLAEHGVKKPYLYGHCTDAMYKKILGNTARNLRKDLQLAPKTNIRNYLVKEDLVTVSFAEMVIKKNIEKKKLYYYKNCKKECEKSSEEVMNLLK